MPVPAAARNLNYWSVDVAASYAKVSNATVQRWANQGLIPSKFEDRRLWVERTPFTRFVESRKNKAARRRLHKEAVQFMRAHRDRA